MKMKLYTNRTVVPHKIRNFFIDDYRVQFINDAYIIVTNFELPLCFPIHFVLHKNRVIHRAYIDIRGNYIKIPIPENHYEIMNLAKEYFKLTMKDLQKNKDKGQYSVSLHKHNSLSR